MVKKVIKKGNTYFECEACSFLYKEKKWADKCEAYCNNHHSCSLEITRHAVKVD